MRGGGHGDYNGAGALEGEGSVSAGEASVTAGRTVEVDGGCGGGGKGTEEKISYAAGFEGAGGFWGVLVGFEQGDG